MLKRFLSSCALFLVFSSFATDHPPVSFKGVPLPVGIDTSLLMRADNGKLLHFSAYFELLYAGEHFADIEKGNWYLRKYPDSVLRFVKMYRDRLDSTSRVKNIFQRLGRADKVVVLKGRRRLYIQRGGKNLFSFPVNLGKNPVGHKMKEGDGRTPEGSYELDSKLWRAKYYTNFHISYPDSNDVLRARKLKVPPGGDVMIHGTSAQRSNRKDWTNGCIAISNAQMDTLFKYVAIGTMIEIRK